MADLTKVNPQILDAVNTTNSIVVGAAASEGVGIVRQQVAQSTGLAIQDAVDQLQQLLVLNSAVTGKAMAVIFTNQEQIPQALLAVETMQSAVNTGVGWFQQIGDAAASILAKYPSPSPS
jgi:hypothetical protein